MAHLIICVRASTYFAPVITETKWRNPIMPQQHLYLMISRIPKHCCFSKIMSIYSNHKLEPEGKKKTPTWDIEDRDVWFKICYKKSLYPPLSRNSRAWNLQRLAKYDNRSFTDANVQIDNITMKQIDTNLGELRIPGNETERSTGLGWYKISPGSWRHQPEASPLTYAITNHQATSFNSSSSKVASLRLSCPSTVCCSVLAEWFVAYRWSAS